MANPWDNSNILLSNRSGANLSRGVESGIAAMAQGLLINSQKREMKEKEKQMRAAVESAGANLFGPDFNLADAPKESWSTIIQLEQAKQQQEQSTAQQQTQQAALSAAAPQLTPQKQLPSAEAVQTSLDQGRGVPQPTFTAGDANQALATYLSRGGRDTAIINSLTSRANNQATIAAKPKPKEAAGFGTAEEAVAAIPEGAKGQVTQTSDGRYVVQYQVGDSTPQGSTTPLDKLIRERDAWAAQGREDVVAKYDDAIQNYGVKYDAFGNPVSAPAKPQFEKGTRIIQKGVEYEFDGKEWKPVTETK